MVRFSPFKEIDGVNKTCAEPSRKGRSKEAVPKIENLFAVI